MGTPGTLNLTNNDRECHEADERTPLLKEEVARYSAGNGNGTIARVCHVDEEAAPLADKSTPQEQPRNIGGVISILLIGVSTWRSSSAQFSFLQTPH